MPRAATWIALPFAGALALAALAALAACSSTSTTSGISPPTGVLVRSESLVSGFGCGVGSGQVFKFAAAVTDDDGAVLGGTTYDCFADGSFQNLPPSSTGSFHYTISIYAYDKATYTASASAIEGAAGSPKNLAALPSSWTTTCDATQEADVEVIALCAPLATSTSRLPGSVRIPTDTFALGADAGALACGTDYTGVRTTGDAGAAASVTCPNALVFSGRPAGEAFSVDLELAFAGAHVGQVTCHAAVAAGTEVTATCDPATKP